MPFPPPGFFLTQGLNLCLLCLLLPITNGNLPFVPGVFSLRKHWGLFAPSPAWGGGGCCCCCPAPKSCPTHRHPRDCSTPGSMGSPGKGTGVGRYFLLQGIFPAQGSNLGLLHWQVDSLPLTTKEACCPTSKQPKSHRKSARKETPGFPTT